MSNRHGDWQNPPLHKNCSRALSYNLYGDGLWVARSAGVEVIEVRHADDMMAYLLLRAEIERRLPESHTDDETVIKSNELHIAWDK